jgi:HAD superfamily hydrolase (TIGR01458 family)
MTGRGGDAREHPGEPAPAGSAPGAPAGSAPGAPAGSAPGAPADPPEALRRALAGVRGLLLDMDGVVVLKGAPIPGAGDAVRALHERGIPFRFVTNASLWSRTRLAGGLARAGVPVDAAHIVSSLSASATLAARRWPGGRLYVLCAPDARDEFTGQRLLTDEEAAAAGSSADAVIVGDAGEGFTYARLNAAFRLVHGGARLVAMHRNPWWLTPAGITLDSGAFVRGLEFATRRRALLVGKPATPFFAAALDSLGVPREEVAMVGDDLIADIAGARRAGIRTALVLSGKTSASDLAATLRRADGARPDAVAASLAGVVAALD